MNCLDGLKCAIGSCDFTTNGEINAVVKEMATQTGVPYSKLMQFCRTVVTGAQVNVCVCVVWCVSLYVSHGASLHVPLYTQCHTEKPWSTSCDGTAGKRRGYETIE